MGENGAAEDEGSHAEGDATAGFVDFIDEEIVAAFAAGTDAVVDPDDDEAEEGEEVEEPGMVPTGVGGFVEGPEEEGAGGADQKGGGDGQEGAADEGGSLAGVCFPEGGRFHQVDPVRSGVKIEVPMVSNSQGVRGRIRRGSAKGASREGFPIDLSGGDLLNGNPLFLFRRKMGFYAAWSRRKKSRVFMELLKTLIEWVLHIDHHLDQLFEYFGVWTYIVLFAIIFAETGLVVTPFLPGDSLLFAIGALAARGSLDMTILSVSLIVAAVLGDTVNYWVGSILGPKIFRGENVRFLNKKHLEKTHEFFERYGGKTIIIARFVPIVRTFAPFVAGMGKMTYRRFMAYNVVGGVVWILLFLWAGYFFGNFPSVKKNFTLVILGIIFVSILPAVIEIWRERVRIKKAVSENTASEKTVSGE